MPVLEAFSAIFAAGSPERVVTWMQWQQLFP